MKRASDLTYWLAVFAHNWIAHPLLPLASLVPPLAPLINRFHDWTALPFGDPEAKREVIEERIEAIEERIEAMDEYTREGR